MALQRVQDATNTNVQTIETEHAAQVSQTREKLTAMLNAQKEKEIMELKATHQSTLQSMREEARKNAKLLEARFAESSEEKCAQISHELSLSKKESVAALRSAEDTAEAFKRNSEAELAALKAKHAEEIATALNEKETAFLKIVPQ